MSATTNTSAARRAAQRRSRSDATQWAQALPSAFLLCRDLGHTWEPYRGWVDRAEREYVQVLRCPRCQTERERRLDYQGRRNSQSYSHPEGYLQPAGSGYLDAESRADLRLVSLLQLIDETQEPPADIAAHRRRRGAAQGATTKRKAG